MSDEDTAKALARWLETPGSPPPADLDRGVIEAIYALRPDLAPPPRLTADDILATVTRGPLAGGVHSPIASTPRGGEVVAFPGDTGSADSTVDTEPDRATRASRWWWWAGGTGGVGLAIAAAATLALIALPEMPTTSQPAGEALGEVLLGREQAAAPASSPYREADLSLADEKKRKDDAPVPQAAPPQAPTAAPLEAHRYQTPPQNVAIDMVGGAGEGAGMRDEVTIPEVASTRSAAKEEAADAETPAEPAPPPPAAASEDVGALAKENEEAQSAASAPAVAGAVVSKSSVAEQDKEEAWRQDVDDRTLDRIDDALRRAERVRAKNPAEAASILAEVVGPPAAAGQHVAALAAADYLTAGNPDAAEAVARQGLALSEEPSNERARLQVLEQEAAQQSP